MHDITIKITETKEPLPNAYMYEPGEKAYHLHLIEDSKLINDLGASTPAPLPRAIETAIEYLQSKDPKSPFYEGKPDK